MGVLQAGLGTQGNSLVRLTVHVADHASLTAALRPVLSCHALVRRLTLRQAQPECQCVQCVPLSSPLFSGYFAGGSVGMNAPKQEAVHTVCVPCAQARCPEGNRTLAKRARVKALRAMEFTTAVITARSPTR